MLRQKIQNLVRETTAALCGEDKLPENVVIEKPKNNFGDYAVNVAFGLAKKMGKSAENIAQELAEKISADLPPEFEKAEAVGGYVNFFLSPKYLREQLSDIASQKNYEKSGSGKGQTVIVEYSQPNIAKKMHVGHLRNTILGDALANIYENQGYKVIRWNYLGDWGTQFGNLIAAYKRWGNEDEVKKNPIETLMALYLRFTGEAKSDAELNQIGRDEFKKLEEGDEENLKLWKWFKELSLEEFNKTYRQLDIKFDVDIGESFYEKGLKTLVAKLKEDGLAENSEGGVIIKLEKFGLPPALIQKSDGASLYLTRDIANLEYRLKKYQPVEILYVVGNEQSLHFQQLLAIAEMLKLDQAKLKHIKYGLVLGEDKKKLATREGRVILAEDLIEKSISLAREIIQTKNPDLADKDRVAKDVGIGALKYEMLKDSRTTDMVFDWKRMLDFTGNSGPYLQYTYARLNGILEKVGVRTEPDFGQLTEKTELNLIKQLIEFPANLTLSYQTDNPNHLTLYLHQLANLTNNFYEKIPVLKDENENRRLARLALVEIIAKVLGNGLSLLGIRAPRKI